MRGPSARTLARALVIVGSANRLAEVLNVPLADLEGWLAGKAQPPHEVFIAALDIVARGAGPVRKQRGPS